MGGPDTGTGETSVKLFEVFNTAHRSLLVLASDKAEAIDVAYGANHLHFVWSRKDKNYPHAAELRSPANERKLAYHLDLIELAIGRRLRGVVRLDGECLYVGHELVRP